MSDLTVAAMQRIEAAAKADTISETQRQVAIATVYALLEQAANLGRLAASSERIVELIEEEMKDDDRQDA